MALFSRKNIKSNPYGLTKDDLKEDIEDFPMGVVVRMMEEQELQGNEPDVKVFQRSKIACRCNGGFDFDSSIDGFEFWSQVNNKRNLKLFFKRYPEYARYNPA